jgi:hypothetical protein
MNLNQLVILLVFEKLYASKHLALKGFIETFKLSYK